MTVHFGGTGPRKSGELRTFFDVTTRCVFSAMSLFPRLLITPLHVPARCISARYTRHTTHSIFTARCYASAVLANKPWPCVRPSVCPSVTMRISLCVLLGTPVRLAKTDGPIEKSFAGRLAWAQVGLIMYWVGSGSPTERGALLGVMLGHALTCSRSIFSNLFARRQQRYGLGLLVYCRNLLSVCISENYDSTTTRHIS